METSNFKELRYVEDMKIVKNKRKQLLAGNKQFTDKDFPMEIGIDAAHDKQIHWKRILDLDGEARLFARPNSLAGSMEVGLLEDHNFTAVLTAIWNHPKLLNYVFPPGQDFDSPDYCGFFYFRFWKMGKWVYVVVDDKVPILGRRVDDPGKKKPDRQKKTPGSGRRSLSSELKTGSKAKMEDSSKIIDVSDPPQQSDPQKSSDKEGKPNENEPTKGNANEYEPKKDDLDGNNPNTSEVRNLPDVPGKEPTHGQKTGEDPLKPVASSQTSVMSKTPKTDDQKSPQATNLGAEDTKKLESIPIYVQVVGAKGERYYWATLFEKAYAKLCGGYHLMAKMSIVETLLAVSGGIIEVYYTKYLRPNFFLSLKHFSDNRGIILATSTITKKNDDDEEDYKNEEGTFFAVTQTVFADFRKLLGLNKMMGFVRLRNPNGALEWDNNWIEASIEWKMLPSEVKNKLHMSSNEDDEFYLSYDNFLKAFSSVIVSTVSDGDNFNCEGYFGIWTRPRLKYNLCNFAELRFHEFPQHKIWVRDPNCDDNLFVEVLISLIQSGNCCCSEKSWFIGMMFFLFCLELGRTFTPPLGFNFFRYNKPIGCSNYSTEKEVSGRFCLPPGHYLVVVVPDDTSFVHPCLTNDYLLRVVTPSKFPKPPPPHMAVTFCESENLNIYFDYAEMIEEPKIVVTSDSKDASQTDSNRTYHKDKGSKTKKKKTKH